MLDFSGSQDLKGEKRYALGIFASVVGIFVNILLSASKFLIGALSGSVAMIADAFNNLLDSASSGITLISLKIASKPADKKHPFGHERMEYVSSMVVSFLILLVGVELFVDSLKILIGITEPRTMRIDSVSLAILAVAILVKLCLGIFYNEIGKKIGSMVLRAAAQDSFMDCIATLAVLVSSILIKFTSCEIVDPIVGILVAMLIVFSGAKILNEMKNTLLGEPPVTETVDKIKAIVDEYPSIVGMHDLMIHNYGPHHCIASFHAEVTGGDDIYLLFNSISELEEKIKKNLGIVCTIHIDFISRE